MVTLYVKDDKYGSKGFSIHEHLLCNASPFFKTAFQGDFAEGQTSLCLADVDYDTVNHLVPWLYSGRLSREAREVDLCSLYRVAARLNTFALTYELSGLTEEALSVMKGCSARSRDTDNPNWLPDVSHIAEIYKKSPASNPMRRFVVEAYGTKLQPSWYASGNLTNEYLKKCPQFIVDVFVESGKKTISLEDQIAVLTTSNADLKSSRDEYVRECRQSDRRVDELEGYLSQNCDVDPRDI